MYPTINKMAAAILAQLDPTLESAPAISQVDAIRAMIEQYSIDMPTVTLAQKVAQDTVGATVVITGTTGGLGSDILLKLLHDDAVEHIYALNRSSSSATIEARQSAAFRTRY
jgi:FlaA1/EpsC-like NDP-sugar epimerase